MFRIITISNCSQYILEYTLHFPVHIYIYTLTTIHSIFKFSVSYLRFSVSVHPLSRLLLDQFYFPTHPTLSPLLIFLLFLYLSGTICAVHIFLDKYTSSGV